MIALLTFTCRRLLLCSSNEVETEPKNTTANLSCVPIVSAFHFTAKNNLFLSFGMLYDMHERSWNETVCPTGFSSTDDGTQSNVYHESFPIVAYDRCRNDLLTCYCMHSFTSSHASEYNKYKLFVNFFVLF